MSAETKKQTTVEDGTEIKGSLSSKCPIVVLGRVEGEIAGPSLQVAETGVVSGTVKVEAVDSRGEIAGRIEAERVTLSGKVRDATVIRTRSLDVKLGRADGALEVVFGSCEIEAGEVPRKEDAVRGATEPRSAATEAAAASAESAAQ